jgi:DNA polymerase-3 subunit epsilon
MSKLFFFDVETSGLIPAKNAIHQISAMIVINGEIKETLDFKVAPHMEAIIEESALAVSKVTKEQIMAYPPPPAVHKELLDKLGKYCGKFDKYDKYHLVGYNNKGFDNEFIRNFFNHCNDKFFGSWFWADSIDVLVLASNYLQDERAKLENFQLRTVAKYLGIEVDETKLHDAQYDIYLTMEIYKIVGNNKKIKT